MTLMSLGFVILVFLVCDCSSKSTDIQLKHKNKEVFKFKDEMVPTEELENFQAISSHGVNDVSCQNNSTTIYALTIRMLYLILLFLPLLVTSPIALVIQSFRENVWYQLLTFTLANGGAVST